MKHDPFEKEVKFFINDLSALKDRLIALGAVLIRSRTREINYRFDTPDLALAKTGRALRVRQDQKIILTFKGPSSQEGGVRVRAEYEVIVDNLDSIRAILSGLGYVQTVIYEKFRAVYQLRGMEITLDELPYGNFTEIEGAEPTAIQAAARVLALNWDARIPMSYLELFERLKKNRSLPVSDLTFKEFSTISVTSADLEVRPADILAYL